MFGGLARLLRIFAAHPSHHFLDATPGGGGKCAYLFEQLLVRHTHIGYNRPK